MNRGNAEWAEYLRLLLTKEERGETLTTAEQNELDQGVMAGAI